LSIPAPARGHGLRLAIPASFVLSAALVRLLPHPPNFTPVGALALFAGATFASTRTAVLVPLLAMALADLLLHWRHGNALHRGMPAVYGCMLATVWLGRRLVDDRRTMATATASLLAALLFFVATNFVVWLAEDLYPHDLAGLLACYVAALPFFGPTLASQLLFAAVLFGGQRHCERLLRAVVARPRVAP
jgi:hypothetical protein